MNINVCRIDDRLIHGQIVTKWIKEANAKMILVSDDKAASDKMLQTILKLAVPSGISLEILNKEDTIKRVKEDNTNVNVLMLVRNRTQLLDYIYVEPDDVTALKAMHEKGIVLEVKAVPEERAKDPIELIAKKIG